MEGTNEIDGYIKKLENLKEKSSLGQDISFRRILKALKSRFKDKFQHIPENCETKEELEIHIDNCINILKDMKEDKSKESKKEDKKSTEKETIAELTDTLQRLQAEFENYKKRIDKENAEFVKYAKAELVYKLLPLLDTFEIALKNTSDKEKFVKGIEIVYAQLFSTLESEGLKPIEALGKKFDPYLHEVMLKQKSDKEDVIVLEELQKGYMLNGKVLRHSKVKISEKVEEKKESNNNKKPLS